MSLFDAFDENNSFEEKQEREFRNKVDEFSYYEGNTERLTLDGEWTEEELVEEVKDLAFKQVGPWKEKHKHSALRNRDFGDELVAESLLSEVDVVELYNTEYDKHKNEPNRKFGIHYFEEAVTSRIESILKRNLIS